jgi:TAG lipase / steryl ester hydrolase / phospholipase A2 / LPA acyltransferase
VNHFIVSQVNPHVVPFLVSAENLAATSEGHPDSAVVAGSGWLHTMASFAKTEAMHRMQVLAELGVFPNYFTKVRSVLSQKYSGDITILPEISYAHFPRVLQNPSAEFMVAAMLAGERATWPKLSRIQNHCAIELALDAAVQKLRAKMVFSPSQVDLRMKSIQTSRQRSSAIGRGVRTAVSKSSKRASGHSKPRGNDNSGLQMAVRPLRRLSRKFSGPATKVDELDSDSEADGDIHPYTTPSPPRKRKSRPSYSPDSDIDSPQSNPRSFSPSSAPGSPASLVSSTPDLWPSTRQLFPSRSQPATPAWPTYHRHQSSSSSALLSGSRWVLPGYNDASSLELSMTMPSPAAQRRTPVSGIGAGSVATPAANLMVDVSGTRGMVLRRKKSRSLY